eukprot:scaffold24040_cov74-Cyclotella_meneghiniana.AAC.5
MKSTIIRLPLLIAVALSPVLLHAFAPTSVDHHVIKTQLDASPSSESTSNGPIPIFKAFFSIAPLAATSAAWAVSGGGTDYASLDLTGQDFSNGNYKGKDFTQGCRFYKAFLVNTNFEGADVRGVSFELTSMDNANLKNINAAGAYFGQSLVDVNSMEGADFTDAQIPDKTLKLVCDREDVKGTNPVTGVDTRDSLMCL